MKKIISVILSVLLIFSFACIGFANKDTSETTYPYVFVHGMMGWGENSTVSTSMPYWGFSEENDVLEYLRGKGYEVCAPSVGPLSSAWDRACELYAQLTGTVVDYGEAHSAKYHHERYGRDYTGKAILGYEWDLTTKINIVTHSFGGPTGTIFCSLLSYGSEEEIKASGDDCSELFKGGHADAVNSLSTLASPHNGSPLSNILYDTKLPVYAVALFVNMQGMSESPIQDFMLDQYGLTVDPSTGKTASFNLNGVINLAKYNDNCAYDMSLQGAKDLMKYKIADSIYLFSYACDMTDMIESGESSAYSGLGIFATIIKLMAGKEIGGVQTTSDWANSDGMVPVASALYPQNAENNHIEYKEGMTLKSGVWYVMPVATGNHGYHCGGDQATLYGFYDELTALVDAL